MSVWAERLARAVDEGQLYVTSAEWDGLRASGPSPQAEPRSTVHLGDLPVIVNDELARLRRREAEATVRADIARLL